MENYNLKFNLYFQSNGKNGPHKCCTGCPKNHGNSVTNSISSLWIILWFSIVIPTEKAVICKSFVCYVSILFVYVLTFIRLYLVKQENCSIQTEKTCPYSLFILQRHYRHIFTVFYPFHKINSSRHNIIMAVEIRDYNANS